VATSALVGYPPHSGTHFAALGDDTNIGALSQTIATTSGQLYTLTYFVASQGDGATFSAQWNGSTLSQLVNPNSSGSFGRYDKYTFAVTGTGSDVLTFHETDVLGYLALDDVSLTPAAAVPGPVVGAGLPGLLAGVGAMLAWYRKKRVTV
jgi:hypothetical protein